MFELAPVSLWLEDYSGLRQLFDEWRTAGVTSLREHLDEDPERVLACSSRIRVIKVNRKTLSLFGAESLTHLVANLDRIFRGDMLKTHVDELVQLWNGELEFGGNAVNYALSGKRLDIQLKGTILPGHEERWDRVLVAIEDVTERETARRELATSEAYARGLFEHSPVSLWVEDFSVVKQLLDDVRQQGIRDFRTFTDVHPEFTSRCLSEVRVIDVNRHTLELFDAPDKKTLLNNLGEVFREQREVVNYSLTGDELHLHLQFSVLPGYEHDWSLVQVALTDITARKRAEAYLEYLGKHDVLTKLYNRSFYVDELNRLERKGPFPVTVVIIDLNGLKMANDQMGHAVGDALLRRAGEVLGKAVDKPSCAARIGGDEFALLMPGMEERDAKLVLESIENLLEVNNQFYTGLPLSFSMGVATSEPGERLEAVVKRADLRMYEAKRAYYASLRGNGEA
jgi:diguanylate cyclase (GGDEF)-like protein